MARAAVAIGGNVGDVPATIEAACAELARHAEVAHLRCSSLYRSAPMGAVAGDTFWNAACVFETSLEPHALLAELQRIENMSGRTREVRWGPRTLDLDLILYGDEIVDSDTLTVPHPHFWYRRFVLEPLAELIPEFVAPGFSQSIQELNERLCERPFRLVIGGDCDSVITRRIVGDVSESETVRTELIELPSLNAVDSTSCSLAISFGTSDATLPKPATKVLHCEQFEAQFLRDTLAAAIGELGRVSAR
jgi:2-amino-4-hydroxy-6-hydroxymethyldihydropteridine diphosphokinase